MSTSLALLGGHFILAAAATLVAPDADYSQDKVDALIRQVYDKQFYPGDFRAESYIKESEKGKDAKVYQIEVYRRAADDKILVLFSKPKQDAGKGYLRIDKNIWFYDPATGKWDRRTEREQLGGSNTRQRDFDSKDLKDDYVASFAGVDKLGSYTVTKIKLTARSKEETAYPLLVVWIESTKRNILKREEYSATGKLLRSVYYPKWEEMKTGQAQKPTVWVATEMRIYDEIEKGRNTIVQLKEASFDPLAPSLFSKAWVEGKSR